ncbi:hydrolase 1, exosortase A system-associated [Rhodoferax koreense]|uniref:Hydrolase 1, exosortase A system-associated n=1 Tax=Rhodoferax koreensis TaxID=1842727 RepID=A0A1P8K0G2_9BURK|nr:hydrolase 1, exosortase A system-associated [Rhodoferax koreense]APW39482.1 hydrolase 1, exosortase A system-associated [Rhodoferax koreense]
MNYREKALVFHCAEDTLLGILSVPERAEDTGVVVIVGGPQYRAGSHRQFVLLSRALASAGYAVLRFDYRGMGDSSGDARDFLGANADVAAAIDAMQTHMPNVRNVVLWGLCDGASAALLYCDETSDERVAGLCLLNPWVRSDASLARTQVKHYYTQRLLQRDFWYKLFSGKVAMKALSGLLRNLQMSAGRSSPSQVAASFQQRMARAWSCFPGGILLLLSGKDYTAKEFLGYAQSDPAWQAAWRHPKLSRHDLPEADHTFSDGQARRMVEQLTSDWLQTQAPIDNAPRQAPLVQSS